MIGEEVENATIGAMSTTHQTLLNDIDRRFVAVPGVFENFDLKFSILKIQSGNSNLVYSSSFLK